MKIICDCGSVIELKETGRMIEEIFQEVKYDDKLIDFCYCDASGLFIECNKCNKKIMMK